MAFGQQSLPAVMTAWMNSSGHRKNILSRKAKSVGVARATGDRWVMVLGASC
ncbi:CAP domain-containing protein [Tateyamaria sp.]|uniref:CAP domain-containing protein n=1 Tax=Tateyamaria sp. TaxID=1929288 RepID=UPI003B20CB21